MKNTVDQISYNEAYEYRRYVNSLSIEDIKLIDVSGNIIEVLDKDREEFKFTGLSTWDFVDRYMPEK